MIKENIKNIFDKTIGGVTTVSDGTIGDKAGLIVRTELEGKKSATFVPEGRELLISDNVIKNYAFETKKYLEGKLNK